MIYGVDYDTNRIAICVMPIADDAEATCELWTLPYRVRGADAFQAVRRIPVVLGAFVDIAADQNGVWMVEHAFGKGPTDFKLGRVQGAIMACLPADAAVNEAGPSEWKRGIGFSGNAKKDAYVPPLRHSMAEFGVDPDQVVSEHETDAFGLALYARIVNRGAGA